MYLKALPSVILWFMKRAMIKIFSKIRFMVLAFAASFALGACGFDVGVGEKIAAARKRNDGPALWKVTDHNSVVYLFGSVHLLPDGADWQRRDLQAAFDEVGTVFFEIPDTDAANLEASILQRQYGVYASGDRLSAHLDGITQKHLTAAAYNAQLSPDKLEIFKPWLVADILSIAAAQEAGLLAKNSADTALRGKAKKAGKVIKTFDDMRTYIEAVALLPDWVQLNELSDTVKDLDTFAGDIKMVNAAWLVGDTETLTRELLLPAQAGSPEIYAALFTERNAKWSKVLDRFLEGDETALVVVGIGHMLGDDGLPNRLTELGYDVKRVRRFDLPNN